MVSSAEGDTSRRPRRKRSRGAWSRGSNWGHGPPSRRAVNLSSPPRGGCRLASASEGDGREAPEAAPTGSQVSLSKPAISRIMGRRIRSSLESAVHTSCSSNPGSETLASDCCRQRGKLQAAIADLPRCALVSSTVKWS